MKENNCIEFKLISTQDFEKFKKFVDNSLPKSMAKDLKEIRILVMKDKDD